MPRVDVCYSRPPAQSGGRGGCNRGLPRWLKKQPKSRLKVLQPPPPRPRGRRKNAPSAAQATKVDPENTIAAQTQAATTKENPASTTRANDPALESTVPPTTVAEDHVARQASLADVAAGKGEVVEDPTKGNRHSHPAMTTAEETALRFDQNRDAFAGLPSFSASALPAGESADPKNAAEPKLDQPVSSQDESGAQQDASREAIGAGFGAPDGITAAGDDPSEDDIGQAG